MAGLSFNNANWGYVLTVFRVFTLGTAILYPIICYISFLVGGILGFGLGILASAFLPDDVSSNIKGKITDNDIFKTLKEKYDQRTEDLKEQMTEIPSNINDDSELKDFDDIIIDNTQSSSEKVDDNQHISDDILDLKNEE